MNLFKKHVPATEDASAADGHKEIPENSAGEIVQEPGESYISFLNRRAAAGRDPDRLLSISAPPGRENDREFIEDRLANDISEKIKAVAHDSDMNPVNMQTLFDLPYKERLPVIEGILDPGTYILAGASKSGKSLLAYQLAFHVSTGTPMWGHEVKDPGTVLYLALEDDLHRVRARYTRMFGVNPSDKLEIATRSGDVEGELIKQLVQFRRRRSDLRLVIIDTLQKVRRSAGSYSGDYDTMSQLKAFADRYRICLILVHHTRKSTANDIFDMISGSTGIMGSADGAFLLHKEERNDLNAMLDFAGRDSAEKRFNLKRNLETLTWELVSEDDELWRKPPDETLEELAEVIKAFDGSWEGTATELRSVMETDKNPSALAKHILKNAERLLEEYKIRVTSNRNHDGRTLVFSMPVYTCDASDAYLNTPQKCV